MKNNVTEQDNSTMELLMEALAEYYDTFIKEHKKTMKNKKGGNQNGRY